MFKYLALAYIVAVVILSAVTFAAYGWDKRQAKTEGQRIPEKRLHLLAFLGGWPGAIVGQKTFRHKTQKLSFTILTWAAAILHAFIVFGCCYVEWFG